MAYQLYIGADNQTGRVDRQTLQRVLNKRHEGYTIAPAVGFWKGRREDSVVVTVEDEDNEVKKSIRELKRELKQEAIGYLETPGMRFA